MATGYEVKMYADISHIHHELHGIRLALERVATALEGVQRVDPKWRTGEEVQDG